MASLDLVNLAILVSSLLVLFGIFTSLVATRFGVPLLLVFLVLGMLAGEDGPGGLPFDDYETTYLVGSLALAVILFDGGLRTKLSSFKGALAPSLLLATFGVLITAGITGTAAYWIMDGLAPLEAALLGAIVASTDAAAVFFLLRTGGLQLQGRIGSVLEIESGTNDPIAVFLTIVLTEFLLSGADVPARELALRLGEQAVLGAALGVAGGFAASVLLNRVQMSDGLHPVFVVAGAVTVYAATSLIGGSGLLAVYLAGLVMANRPVRAYPSIVGFHDAATWLCQIGMFLVLGLLVTPKTLLEYALPGVLVALVLLFVARPVAVWLCLMPFGFRQKEMLFTSWVGLRGAVSIFLAAIPTLAGVANAEAFFNIAFFVVLLSLLVQGWTLSGMARRLDVAMRRIAPSVRRVEVDIPGQVDQEMVGYPVATDSMILGLSRIPAWVRILFVVRDNEILSPIDAGALEPGDFAYFLTVPARVPRLDRLLSEFPEAAGRGTPGLGELPLNGAASIADIAALYELEIAEADRELTLSDFFARHLRLDPRPGMRLPVGGASLVVRAVEDRVVTAAGLLHDEFVDGMMAGFQARRRYYAPAAVLKAAKELLSAGWRRLTRQKPRTSESRGSNGGTP